VEVADGDDEDATVVLRAQPAPSSIPPEFDDNTVLLEAKPAPASIPPEFDDNTIAQGVPPVPASIPPDEEATVIHDVRPLPAVGVGAQSHAIPVTPDTPGKLASHPIAVSVPETTVEQPVPAAVHEKPPAAVVSRDEVPPAAPSRPTSDVDTRELMDEDEDFLPARAKDYAGAHGPPATIEQPRPAAGTPAPPSVIVAQRQVTMDGLGRLPAVHTELTHPAIRSLRPPGTIQISIATLIVGAMALVVLVLAAVLLLR